MRFVVTSTFLSRAGRPPRLLGAIACVLGLALSAPAVAQVTWDAVTGTSGPQDGSGTWSTVDANWWNGSSDVVWPNLSTSTATIGANSGAAGTITVDGSLTLNRITFNAPGSGAYTVTGGTLGFAGSGPRITANTAAVIGSDITSGAGLTKNGTGTLTLSGSVSNTAGGVSFSQGEVTLTGTLTNTAGATLAVGSANGGTLTISGGSLTTSFNNARSIVIAGGPGRTGTIAVTSGTFSPAGLLISEDSGGNGVFTQSGGSTTIGSGNLWLSGNTSSLTVTGGSFTNNNQTYFAAVGISDSTISVSGSGAITLGTLRYGINTRNGFTTTVNVGDGTSGGTLQVNNMVWSGATTVASTINFNGGTFVAGGSFSIPTQIATAVQAGGANINVAATHTLTMSNPLTDGGGAGGLVKLGTGTLALTGANAFTGATRIGAGSLSLGNALALQNSTLDLDGVDAGTVSAIGQDSTLGGLAGSRDLDMLTRTLSIGNNGTSTTYSGALSNGALTKIGAGTLTLTGTNIYTGATTIDGGTLQIGAGGTAGGLAGTSTITGSSGAGLVFSRTDNYGGNVSNDIGGGLALTLNSGTLTITGSNTYSGTTAINGGVLGLGAAGALGGAGDIVFGGGTLQFSASNAGDYAARIKNSGSAIAVDTNGRNVTFAGAIDSSNTGGLVKSGAGTLTLSGSNAYAGGTTLSGGELTLGDPNALGADSLTFNLDANANTYFNLPAGGTVANDITINKPGANRTYYLLQRQSNNVELSGDITVATGNSLRFGLNGTLSGTFTLTGNNAFGADVITDAGVTMRIGGANAAGGQVWRPNVTANMVLLDGANFKSVIGNAIASYSMETSGTATVSADVFNRNTANVAVNLPANAELRFTGVLRAEGGFTTGAYTKTGAGTWVVSNATNAAFTYNLNEGVMQIPAFGALGGQTDASWLVLNGGTLRYTGATTTTAKQFTLGGSGGSLDASGSGAVAFTSGSAVAFTGSGNRTLTLAGTNTGDNTLAAVIGDNGGDAVSLAKTGGGTWLLSGSNTYSGGTSIGAGVLEIGAAGSINSTSGITLNGSTAQFRYNAATALTQSLTLTQGTISGTGTIGAAVTVAAGGVLSPGNSPGTQAYTGQLTWSPLGTYQWELNALTGQAGTNWDLLDVSGGTFDLSGLSTGSGGQFVLDLITLDAGDAAGPLAIPFDGGSYTLPIATYDAANFLLPSGFTNTAGADLTDLFTVSLANWQGTQPQVGDLSVRINSTATGLDVVIVPEPGTLGVMWIGLALAGVSLRRRWRPAS
jgi:fibronectin-binding autotransporter adhesin